MIAAPYAPHDVSHGSARYAGVPSPAMRARYSDVAPEVLRLCCVLADIMYDIATVQQHEDGTT